MFGYFRSLNDFYPCICGKFSGKLAETAFNVSKGVLRDINFQSSFFIFFWHWVKFFLSFPQRNNRRGCQNCPLCAYSYVLRKNNWFFIRFLLRHWAKIFRPLGKLSSTRMSKPHFTFRQEHWEWKRDFCYHFRT